MFDFHGRMINIYDDEKTQSVNICTPANTEGQYEQVFYFTGKSRVTRADVEARTDMADLVKWLRRSSYDQVFQWVPKA